MATDPQLPDDAELGDAELGDAEEYVTIFVANDVNQQMVAESLLQEAGIPFSSKNAVMQHMLGWGQVGGANLVAGPVKIQVAASDAEEARRLFEEGLALETEEMAALGVPAELAEPAIPEDPRIATVRRAASASVLLALFFFGTYGSVAAVFFGLRALAVRSDGIPNFWRVFAMSGALLGLVGVWVLVTAPV